MAERVPAFLMICRAHSQHIDLLDHARTLGYHITDDREDFNAHEAGLRDIKLPILGLYNNSNHLAYEIDRHRQSEETR